LGWNELAIPPSGYARIPEADDRACFFLRRFLLGAGEYHFELSIKLPPGRARLTLEAVRMTRLTPE